MLFVNNVCGNSYQGLQVVHRDHQVRVGQVDLLLQFLLWCQDVHLFQEIQEVLGVLGVQLTE